MPANNDEDQIDLDEAFKVLREYQQEIEQRAKIFIGSIKKSIAIRELVQPGFSEPFARKHKPWYDQVEQQIIAAGFQPTPEYRSEDLFGNPPEKQAHYKFAMSPDGTVWATWFLFPSEPPLHGVIMQSWATDGAQFETVSGLAPSGIPTPPHHFANLLPADLPVASIIDAHRSYIAASSAPMRKIVSIEEYLAARADSQRELGEWRESQGVALVAPRVRAYYKGKEDEEEADEVIAAIDDHPEWWTGEAPRGDQPASARARLPITFLMSRDPETGRGHMTTFGLTMRALRELQMKDVAANHCRAA